MQQQAHLSPLFAPESIAVIGASATGGKVGNIIVTNLLEAGYAGRIIPVNPTEQTILGLPTVNKIADLAGLDVDLAVICVPAAAVPQAFKELAEVKVKAVIVISAGFKEVGGAGMQMEAEIAELARKHGIRLLGPNCVGLINTASKINATFLNGYPRPGGISFFSQSGAMCIALLDWANHEGIGFSSFVSLGNKAGVDESDMLGYLASDPDTKVIVGYLENVNHGQRFLQQAQRASRRKPVIILRSGSTQAGAKAASSHTGALAGPDMAYDAAFKQCGVIRARHTDDLFNLARAFAMQPLPLGPGVGILTNAGGPGIVAADACEAAGLNVADFSFETIAKFKEFLPPFAALYNPVDVVGDSKEDAIARAADILLQENSVQSLLAIVAPTRLTTLDNIAEELIKVFKKYPDKPIFCCFMGGEQAEGAHAMLNDAGYPFYSFPEAAVEAIAAMYRHKQWTQKSQPVEVGYRRDLPKAQKVIAEARKSGLLELVEFQAQELFMAYEMPMLKAKLARSSEEAIQIAKQIGHSVALKIASPQISHKTDVNGVVLNLESPAAIRNAFTEITSRARRLRPDAFIAGCLVQAMAPRGSREVIVGFKREQPFGPMIIFGLGGIHVEVFKDISSRIAPLSLEDVQSMIREVKAFPVLAGLRGEKKVNFTALEDILFIMSQLAQDFPEIQEAECNPVLANERGAVVADMRVILSR